MRRIACPVEWCTGYVLDHGGDGADPDEWRHSDDGTDLVYGGALYRSQRGGGPAVWEMAAGGSVVAVGSDLAHLADRLREIADRVSAACVKGAQAAFCALGWVGGESAGNGPLSLRPGYFTLDLVKMRTGAG